MKLFVIVFLLFAEPVFAKNLIGYTFSKDQKSTPFKLELSPFSTDGCTRYYEGITENPHLWLECCIQHDFAYWLGGTKEQRKAADDEILQCVRGKGAPVKARLMYIGTRIGGSPVRPTTYRWGYGWNRVRNYHEISVEEKKMATDMYGENLEILKKEISGNKFEVVVPESYSFKASFQYSFCDEQIIEYLAPKMATSATVTKYKKFEVNSSYFINLSLDVCDETIEFEFNYKTTAHTCRKDLDYDDSYNRIKDVKISKACLQRIESQK